MKRMILGMTVIAAILTGQEMTAQNNVAEATDLAERIITANKVSNDLLPKYSWTSRVEILKSKEILNMMIEKNHFDQEGQLVQVVLNEQGAKMPKAFLIREIAESEKENMEKFLYRLRDFLKKYAMTSSDQVKRFITSATWQVVDSTHEFIFTGRNVEEPGDQLTWWVEDLFYTTARIEVNTIFEKDAVRFTGTFIRLRDGLNYMAYAEAFIPGKNITLQLQNYDYLRE